MQIEYLGNPGDTEFFKIDGVEYGIDPETFQICDFEGYPQGQEWRDLNWELVDVLIDAVKGL